MPSRSEEENVSTVVASAYPSEVPQDPEVSDFEKLLSDLAAAFIRVSVEDIDREIERWLQHMVFALDIDRGTVLYLDPADGALSVTHQFAREGVNTLDKGTDARVNWPWYSARILSGELLVLSRLEEAPPEAFASKDRISAGRDGTKSNVTIPLIVGGVAIGAVSFGTVFFERKWTKEEVRRLKLVGEILRNALERKRAFAEHRRLEEEVHQIARVASMGELTAALSHEFEPAARSNSEQCESCSTFAGIHNS